MKRVMFIAALAACRGDNVNDTAKLERVMRTSLAKHHGLHVGFLEKEDVGFYWGHARFDGDPSIFEALCRELEMGAAGTPVAGGLLPTSWDWAIGGAAPTWWSPAKATPSTSCARKHGQTGWIAAKLEGAFIYLVATDMPQS